MAAVKKTKKPSLKIKKGLVFVDKDGRGRRGAPRKVEVVKKDPTREDAWLCKNVETSRVTPIAERTLRAKFVLETSANPPETVGAQP